MEVDSDAQEPQIATIVADNVKMVGVNSNVYIFPIALRGDGRARTSFQAVKINERTITNLDSFPMLTILIAVPPAYLGLNWGGFSDAEVDRLHGLAVGSMDERVQQQATVDLNRRLSETAGYGPLYYIADVLVARSRVRGPAGEALLQQGGTANIFEWEVTD